MKKKLTLAMMVITIIEAVCMFIPGIVELGSKDMNAFAGFRGENAGIANTFSKITLFLLVASFVCLFSALLEKRNILSKLSAWLPLASFVSLLAFVGGCSQIDYENYAGYRYQIGRLGSILVIISVVSAVLSLVVKYAKLDDAPAKKVPVGQTSKADEIKKYKDLLDSGIITQEEFEAKKIRVAQVTASSKGTIHHCHKALTRCSPLRHGRKTFPEKMPSKRIKSIKKPPLQGWLFLQEERFCSSLFSDQVFICRGKELPCPLRSAGKIQKAEDRLEARCPMVLGGG